MTALGSRVRYTRDELQRLIALRHGQLEGQGENAFLEFRVKVTPELLAAILGGHWTPATGVLGRVRLASVTITEDGYLEPELVADEVPA